MLSRDEFIIKYGLLYSIVKHFICWLTVLGLVYFCGIQYIPIKLLNRIFGLLVGSFIIYTFLFITDISYKFSKYKAMGSVPFKKNLIPLDWIYNNIYSVVNNKKWKTEILNNVVNFYNIEIDPKYDLLSRNPERMEHRIFEDFNSAKIFEYIRKYAFLWAICNKKLYPFTYTEREYEFITEAKLFIIYKLSKYLNYSNFMNRIIKFYESHYLTGDEMQILYMQTAYKTNEYFKTVSEKSNYFTCLDFMLDKYNGNYRDYKNDKEVSVEPKELVLDEVI